MIRCDAHMHTRFSEDSDASVHYMLDAAIERGMEAVCITDHLDKDFPQTPDFPAGAFLFDLGNYFQRLTQLKEEYQKKLEVRIGVEIGLQPHLGEYYKELTEKYPFDFVIGSVHLIHGQDPYYRGFFEGRSDEEAYHEAFEVTIENLKKINSFDSLGHLDYVVRYGTHQAEEYSYRKYADEIDEILKHLISHGKGLEMNMAGMKYGLGFPNPHPDVIRRYRELGGEIVTIGADAHRPEHVAFDFDKAGEILISCGFSYYAEFKGRKPIFKRIVP